MENVIEAREFDLGIVVPLREEFRVLRELCTATPLTNRDAIQYYDLRLPYCRAVAVVLGEMGKNVASQLTEKMLAHFDLSTIVLLGIAGAIDKDLKLGDVVVADEINDFQAAAKAVQKGRTFEFQYSGSRWKTDFAIRRCVRDFEFAAEELFKAWQRQVQSYRAELGIGAEGASLFKGVPEARVGHIASGDTVGAAKAFSVELRGIDRKFLALEMEAAGFAQAAHGRMTPVRTMVVRGISDFADERKKDLDSVGSGVWRRYAMYSASACLLNLLKAPSFREILMAEGDDKGRRPPLKSVPTAPDVPNRPVTVPIAVGPFWMGSSSDDPEAHENEKPRRKLSLREYCIGHYPVTNAQYAAFVEATAHPPPEHWDQGKVPTDLQDHPVVNVNYGDAAAYCHWLSSVTDKPYRLPTEEEWEKAARGSIPEARRYPWGDEWRLSVCNTQELEKAGTTPVHAFEQVNCSPFGVVDMVGNVWEWTASSYSRYPGSPHQSLRFESNWVVRGGSWRNSRRQARISCRGRYPPDVRRPYLGFRIALDADIETERAISMPKSSVTVEPAKLRQNLVRCFNVGELRNLCFDLRIDYEMLPGSNKGDKARELIAYLERRGRIPELVEACRRLRPNASW